MLIGTERAGSPWENYLFARGRGGGKKKKIHPSKINHDTPRWMAPARTSICCHWITVLEVPIKEGHQQKSGLNPDYLQGPSCNVLAEHLVVLMASSPAFRCHYPCSRDVGFDFLVLPAV
uniref:Uncharacterized protein n=1 Tax=Anas platyrhynchos platyrhynchos TaxID=8840 RepID=A0A493TXF3_ANAPP